jgi:hypothetical protein
MNDRAAPPCDMIARERGAFLNFRTWPLAAGLVVAGLSFLRSRHSREISALAIEGDGTIARRGAVADPAESSACQDSPVRLHGPTISSHVRQPALSFAPRSFVLGRCWWLSRPMMYRGVEYSLVQAIAPKGWRWSFEYKGRQRAGQKADRESAFVHMKRSIDQAIRRYDDTAQEEPPAAGLSLGGNAPVGGRSA